MPRTTTRTAVESVRVPVAACALAALGYWGWHTGDGVGRLALAVAAPVALVGAWATWVAPRSRRLMEDLPRFAIEVVIWCGAGVALVVSGQIILGVTLGGVGITDALALRLYEIGDSVIDQHEVRRSAGRRQNAFLRPSGVSSGA
ncbi:MAG: YrdB family protein [Acidimicrobiia bacterium]|nr:YrdB family protein [Acidimicrobiia bacterium]